MDERQKSLNEQQLGFTDGGPDETDGARVARQDDPDDTADPGSGRNRAGIAGWTDRHRSELAAGTRRDLFFTRKFNLKKHGYREIDNGFNKEADAQNF